MINVKTPKHLSLRNGGSNCYLVSSPFIKVFIFFFMLFCVFSLLAKLDKADRAFCFTSGMAALAAVTHLLNTGNFPILTTLLKIPLGWCLIVVYLTLFP